MRQLAGGDTWTGEVTFVPTVDYVAFTSNTITGRCALLLDLTEVRQLVGEAEQAAERAFGPDWRTR